jgi:hypothetical protein
MPVGQEDVRACGEGCHLEVLNWAREHRMPDGLGRRAI